MGFIVEQGKFYGGINYKLPLLRSKSPCANNVIMTKYVRMLPTMNIHSPCVGHET